MFSPPVSDGHIVPDRLQQGKCIGRNIYYFVQPDFPQMFTIALHGIFLKGRASLILDPDRLPSGVSLIKEDVMQEESYYDEVFEARDYADKGFSGREFESCVFKDCNFSNSNLSQNEFMDCQFHACNMTMANVENTCLKHVDFIDCKLTGVDFGSCNNFLFAVNFKNCRLDYSVFFNNALRKTIFKDCIIQETAFTNSNLSGGTVSEL